MCVFAMNTRVDARSSDCAPGLPLGDCPRVKLVRRYAVQFIPYRSGRSAGEHVPACPVSRTSQSDPNSTGRRWMLPILVQVADEMVCGIMGHFRKILKTLLKYYI